MIYNYELRITNKNGTYNKELLPDHESINKPQFKFPPFGG